MSSKGAKVATDSKGQGSAKTGSAATQFKAGNRANPGGLTVEEREARDAMRKALAEPERRAKGLAAYDKLLDEGNPLIVKDFMDRTAGKVTDRIEVEDTTPKDPTPPLTNDERRELLKLQLAAEVKP